MPKRPSQSILLPPRDARPSYEAYFDNNSDSSEENVDDKDSDFEPPSSQLESSTGDGDQADENQESLGSDRVQGTHKNPQKNNSQSSSEVSVELLDSDNTWFESEASHSAPPQQRQSQIAGESHSSSQSSCSSTSKFIVTSTSSKSTSPPVITKNPLSRGRERKSLIQSSSSSSSSSSKVGSSQIVGIREHLKSPTPSTSSKTVKVAEVPKKVKRPSPSSHSSPLAHGSGCSKGQSIVVKSKFPSQSLQSMRSSTKEVPSTSPPKTRSSIRRQQVAKKSTSGVLKAGNRKKKSSTVSDLGSPPAMTPKNKIITVASASQGEREITVPMNFNIQRVIDFVESDVAKQGTKRKTETGSEGQPANKKTAHRVKHMTFSSSSQGGGLYTAPSPVKIDAITGIEMEDSQGQPVVHPVLFQRRNIRALSSTRSTLPRKNAFLYPIFHAIKNELKWKGNELEMEHSEEFKELMEKWNTIFKTKTGVERVRPLEIQHPNKPDEFLNLTYMRGTIWCGDIIEHPNSDISLAMKKCSKCWATSIRTIDETEFQCDFCVKRGNEQTSTSNDPKIRKVTKTKIKDKLMSVTAAHEDSIQTPLGARRFEDKWLSINDMNEIKEDFNEEEEEEDAFTMPTSKSYLGVIYRFLAEKIGHTDENVNMFDTPAFKQEMIRWNKHFLQCKKDGNTKDRYYPRKIEVPKYPGTFFGLKWRVDSLGYCVTTNPLKPIEFHYKCKLSSCWNPANGRFCTEHKDLTSLTAIVKDTNNSDEDAYAVGYVKNCSRSVFKRFNKKQLNRRSVKSIKFGDYLDSRELLKCEPNFEPVTKLFYISDIRECTKLRNTLELALAICITLRSQELVLTKSKLKTSMLLKNNVQIKGADLPLVRKILEQSGVTIEVGDDSELGKTVKSPFQYKNWTPKLPRVYMALKLPGQIYDGLNLRATGKTASADNHHSYGHALAVNKDKEYRTSYARGVKDASKLKSIFQYQPKLTPDEVEVVSTFSLSTRKSKLNQEQLDLKEKVKDSCERAETLAMLSTIFAEMLGQSIDGYPIRTVELSITNHLNDAKKGDRNIIEKLFEFKTGKKVIISVDLTKDFAVSDDLN